MKTMRASLISVSLGAALALAAQTSLASTGTKVHLFPDESLGGEWPGQSVQPDLVEVAQSAGAFTTLITAVQQAGLVDVLQGDGPFTVFAPTDEAFAQIPADKLQALLADREALTQVLTYHLVPGRVESSDVLKLSSAKTVQGQPIWIDTSSGVKVNDANVIKTDIMARNGVIHVIDKVILPN
jgi:uncharacterized surface protein with fasciclin (FAS1) repeats